jgi:FkbM family methyltransferase
MSARRAILWPLAAYSRIAPTERGGYRLVRMARRLLPQSQWKGIFRTPDGIDLDLDLATYPDCCMAVGLYELDTVRQIRRLLRSGGWFVDCGANIGYFTMLAATWVGANGRVDAFEPDPINRRRLESHLAANRLGDRVRIHPAAVSDQAGMLDLYHPTGADGNHGMSSAYHGLVGQAERYTVPTVRVDEVLEAVPDLIKLDVEGGDYAAIEGMKRLLQSDSPPRLIIEHNHVTAAAAGYTPGDLFRLLVSIQPRYRLHWIGRNLHPLASPEELDAFPRQVNLWVEAANNK